MQKVISEQFLIAPQYCLTCNAQIRPKASFCVDCGSLLNRDTDEIPVSNTEVHTLMLKSRSKRTTKPTLQELRCYFEKRFGRRHLIRKQDDIFGYNLVVAIK